MEAHWLFGVDADAIRVVIHPESILHSAVEFVDGAVIGQMGMPDMKLPIQYALFYPERRPMNGKKLDLFALKELHFYEPDRVNFPAFALAEQVMRTGGSLPTVYNAANEYAVARFLNREICFTEIGDEIARAVEKHRVIANPTLEEILQTEQDTYDFLRMK